MPKFKIEIQKAPEFKIIPATGAWGGITPQEEILCNFFVEYRKYPEPFDIELGEDGKIIKESKMDPEVFIRELQCAILMRPDIARSVGQWLINTANVVLNKGSK